MLILIIESGLGSADVAQLAPAHPGVWMGSPSNNACLTERDVLKLIIWQGWASEIRSWTENRFWLSGFRVKLPKDPRDLGYQYVTGMDTHTIPQCTPELYWCVAHPSSCQCSTALSRAVLTGASATGT